MRKSICLLITIFFALTTYCQVKLSVVAGVNQSTILGKYTITGWKDTVQEKYIPLNSFHTGFKVDIPLTKNNNLFFQSGIVYNTKGRKYYQIYDTTKYYATDSSFEQRINYLDLQFNLLYKKNLSKKINAIVGVGAYSSFLIKNEEKVLVNCRDITNNDSVCFTKEYTNLPLGRSPKKYSPVNFGVNALAGFEIGKLVITAGVNRDISTTYQTDTPHVTNFKNQVYNISIGYRFNTKAFYSKSDYPKITIIAGGNRSIIVEENNIPNWKDTVKRNYYPITGFSVGIKADIPLTNKNNLFLQPGISYYTKGRKYFHSYDTTKYFAIDSSFEQRINYIDFPFNFVYKKNLTKNIIFMAGAGLYASFLVNGIEKISVNYKDTTNLYTEFTDLPIGKGPGKYRTTNLGTSLLVGLEVGKISITMNTSKDIFNMYQHNDYVGKFKNQVYSISIGYAFNSKILYTSP